ncbi:methyltransferase [Candidatus Altiarchaeales archaeon WOR_SM1_SCG]|nr:methyltransferase [Candidatus Altiarchaeales archaeon WOR_SM1_SCG]
MKITSCEVCGNNKLTPVLNLGLHPLCDDLVPIGDSRVCIEYPIEILFCEKCFTAHQNFQVPKRELFPKTYHYRARFTSDVLNGMEELVSSCENQFGSLYHKKILDIGCNDGSLLNFFKDKGAITIGIEPTDAYLDAIDEGHKVFNDFLSLNAAKEIVSKYGKPDYICFTNVFAHIENLDEVISSLKYLIHSKSIIVIENHYLGSILAGNQFDTFYHEHPRTYSYKSFKYISKSLGLDLLGVKFPKRYGGNIRVYIGNSNYYKSAKNDTDAIVSRELKYLRDFEKMQKMINRWVKSKKAIINDYVNKFGKLRAKAFPGRAAILIKMLGLTENEILCVFEKPGSMKIGHYVPGTIIPIVSDNELFLENDKSYPILNLAWHIPAEIRSYLISNGYQGEIIDIISNADFIE